MNRRGHPACLTYQDLQRQVWLVSGAADWQENRYLVNMTDEKRPVADRQSAPSILILGFKNSCEFLNVPLWALDKKIQFPKHHHTSLKEFYYSFFPVNLLLVLGGWGYFFR